MMGGRSAWQQVRLLGAGRGSAGACRRRAGKLPRDLDPRGLPRLTGGGARLGLRRPADVRRRPAVRRRAARSRPTTPPAASAAPSPFPPIWPTGPTQQTILIGDDGVDAALGRHARPGQLLLCPRSGGRHRPAGPALSTAFAGVPTAAPLPRPRAVPPTRWASQTGSRCGARSRRAARPCSSSVTTATTARGDFADATPQPRNNASAITETTCTGPTTTIDSKPANPTIEISAPFTYHAPAPPDRRSNASSIQRPTRAARRAGSNTPGGSPTASTASRCGRKAKRAFSAARRATAGGSTPWRRGR